MTQLLTRLSLRTGGESHGPAVLALLEGLPRGLRLDLARIHAELRRRQGGAGRGGRQRIEDDQVEVLGGVRKEHTIGSPLVLLVRNRDMSLETLPEPTRPRPGHADLAGAYRYVDADLRGTLERASARETAARVAAGAVAKLLLEALGVAVFGFVRRVGGAVLPAGVPGALAATQVHQAREQRDQTALYTLDPDVDRKMLAEVQAAAKAGDTVGGVVEVHAWHALPGLGSHLQWNERLDARLAAGLMSIPAIKAVEIGLGVGVGELRGSQVHDPILPAGADGLPRRASNRAGGIEGGMTNGEPIVVRATMKPISTLRAALPSIDLATGLPATAGYERSDVCAVSAASVIAEAMVALILADAALVRLGGETMQEVQQRQRELQRAWASRFGPRGA